LDRQTARLGQGDAEMKVRYRFIEKWWDDE
jgi:hypothetical protein